MNAVKYTVIGWLLQKRHTLRLRERTRKMVIGLSTTFLENIKNPEKVQETGNPL
jgi:hypothetical protein